MPFTVAELENTANAAIDFYFKRGKVKSQTLQDKPLLTCFRKKQKTFPAGKEYISVGVKGLYSTTIQGFSGDDTVTYGNPTNIKRAKYPWKLTHSGIQFTKDELLRSGISITDSVTGDKERRVERSEEIALADLLEDKMEDLTEGTDRGQNTMFWRDGTQDSKLVPGLTSIIVDDPTAATVVGGIDQSANSWWRNRASLAISTASADANLLVNTLQTEMRQLRRYGGRPNKALAGSDFLEWFEKELRAKGTYTQTGWAKDGGIDAGMGDPMFKGVRFEYDPTLDDLSKAKYAYLIDDRTIFPKVVDGEDRQKHSPARPENKYVFYRAITWVGGLVCTQRNANGVYSIA